MKKLSVVEAEGLVADAVRGLAATANEDLNLAWATPFTCRDGLEATQDLCHGLAKHSGWWLDTETGEDVRTWPKKFLTLWIATKLMLVVTEVAEAMEGHRKNLADDKLPHRPMLEVELADAVIRCFDLAGGLDFDLAGAVMEKLAFNQQRPDHKLEHRVADGGKSV